MGRRAPALFLLGLMAATVADAQDGGCCLSAGLAAAERYRVTGLEQRRFTHAELWRALEPVVAAPALAVEEIGASVEGRALRAVRFGQGRTTVLLWSQMHGDESTATMALADLMRFFAEAAGDPLRERIHGALAVTMVPMLNPDGAERFERRNALGLDVNRDARRLVTPEGRALKAIRDRVDARFGFNLHDQDARVVAGDAGLQVAIALLAPAAEQTRAYGEARARARGVAARIARTLSQAVPGRLAKYDDTFNPRAFGDLMQAWGTSTVLIESGALPDDPQKQRLRALNVAAILSALDAIATGAYAGEDPAHYERLPQNQALTLDLLVKGVTVVMPGAASIVADLGLAYEDAVARTGLRLRDIGDLGEARAMDTLPAAGLYAHPAAEMLEGGHRLRIGAPAVFTLRRGADPESELVRMLGR